MRKINKGEYGYIHKKRKAESIKTISMFAISLAIFVMGYISTKTKSNVFDTFRRQASIQVKIYDNGTKTYQTKTMRIEGYQKSLVQYSDRSTESMGLYTVSFTLEEF